MGVDFEGFFVGFDRLRELLEVGVAMTHSRPGSEMAGHSSRRPAAIAGAFLVILHQIIRNRPLVVRLCKIRIDPDGPAEMLDRSLKILVVQRFSPAANHLIRAGGIPAAEPDRPEGMLSQLIDDRIGVAKLQGKLGDTTRRPHQR